MLWNNKPILKNSLLVWDVENISIKALSSIKHLAKFTPQKCFAISKVPLNELKCKFHFYVSSHFTFMFPPISLKVSTWKQGVK